MKVYVLYKWKCHGNWCVLEMEEFWYTNLLLYDGPVILKTLSPFIRKRYFVFFPDNNDNDDDAQSYLYTITLKTEFA